MRPEAAPPVRRRLVVVDDDRLFLDAFAANLESAGYAAICFDDPRAALHAVCGGLVADACVLDLDMPALDGLAFLRALLAKGIAIPVMFVTCHSGPVFEEEALRSGAVDFVDKNRGPAIILRRLALLIEGRKDSGLRTSAADVRLGKLLLRRRNRRAEWQGAEVALSRIEFEVVQLLAAKSGSDVSYREIYAIIKREGFLAGSGEDGYRTNVRAAIKRIRRKFEDLDAGFAAIENYPGFGYRWRGDA
jgi:two-component system response regulator ChvI